MSSTQPGTLTPSIGTHAVNRGLGGDDGEAQNTTPADPELNNINGQAGNGNRSARNTARGVAPQHCGRPITLVIPTLPETAVTDRQESGTGNGMLQNASSEPAQVFDDPTSFGVPRINPHYTIPPSPTQADNFVSFGISSAVNFSHFGEPVSKLLGSTQRSTSPGRTDALSSNPPAEGNDDGAPGRDIVLRDFSQDLNEWPYTPNKEHGNEHTHYGDQRPNTPIDPADGSFPNGRTNVNGADWNTQAPENPITVVDDGVENRNREFQNGTQSNDLGPPSACMSTHMTFTTDPVVLELHNALSGSSSSGQALNGNDNRNRRAPRPVGSLRRMGRDEVAEFWNDIDGSASIAENTPEDRGNPMYLADYMAEIADREVGTHNGTANNSSPSGAHLSELDLGDSGKDVDPSPFFEDSGKDGNANGSKN